LYVENGQDCYFLGLKPVRESSSILRRILTGLAISAAVAGIIFFGFRIISKPSKSSQENPFEFDLEALQEIDPDLIWYEEVQEIRIPVEKAYGIATGPKDWIYVTGDKLLVIFEKDGTELSRIYLEEAAKCVTVGDDGDIYLGFTTHVEVFDGGGFRKDIWPELGRQAIITSIAVLEEDVFVADAGNSTVLRFDKSGRLLGRIGDRDEARGITGFFLPSPYFDVAGGKNNSIWAANNGNHSMENYSLNGDLLSSWGGPTVDIEGFSGCCNPMHFAVLPDGSFVTSEKGLVRVKIHDSYGEFLCVVAGVEQFAWNTVAPDLAVDSTGRILAFDDGARTVRIFSKSK
jgi:hypothetical protein